MFLRSSTPFDTSYNDYDVCLDINTRLLDQKSFFFFSSEEDFKNQPFNTVYA